MFYGVPQEPSFRSVSCQSDPLHFRFVVFMFSVFMHTYTYTSTTTDNIQISFYNLFILCLEHRNYHQTSPLYIHGYRNAHVTFLPAYVRYRQKYLHTQQLPELTTRHCIRNNRYRLIRKKEPWSTHACLSRVRAMQCGQGNLWMKKSRECYKQSSHRTQGSPDRRGFYKISCLMDLGFGKTLYLEQLQKYKIATKNVKA